MVLNLMLLVSLPAAADIVGNTLDLSDGSAPAAALATVTLGLANEDAVGGIQVDILFDGSVAAFSGMAASGRGAGMTAEGRVVESGRLRVVMYYSGSGTLASGTGPVAELAFLMQGSTGNTSALTITDIVLSDTDGNDLTASATPGSLTVADPVGSPFLNISALKNPGDTHIVMIMVTVSGGSGDAPIVSASGSAVTMSSLADGVFQGQHHALSGQSTLTITATDSNSNGTSNAQIILALP